MNKGFQKIRIILFAIVVLFSSIGSVNAAEKSLGGYTANAPKYSGSATTKIKTADHYSISNQIHAAGKTRSVKYMWHKIDGQYIWCLDAGLGSKSTLYAGRFLFHDQNSLAKLEPNTLTYTYDVGVVVAMSTGYTDYFQQSVAVRAFSATIGFLEWSTGSDAHLQNTQANNFPMDQMKAFYGTANKWVNEDAEIQEYIKTINEGLKLKSAKVGSQLSKYADYYWTGDVSSAKAGFKAALKAAADHVKNLGGSAKLEFSDTTTASDNVKTEDANGTLVTKKVRHTAKVEDYKAVEDKPSIFKFDKIAFDKGTATVGALKDPAISFISVAGNTLCSSSDACSSFMGVNILEGLDLPESFEIIVEVEFVGYEKVNEGASVPLLNCAEQPMSYTIDYSYGGGAFSGGGRSEYEKYLGIVWRGKVNDTDKQRFIGLYGTVSVDPTDPSGDDDLKKGTIKGEVVLNENCAPCEDLIKECEECKDLEACACTELIEKADECGCEAFELLCQIELDSGTPLKDTKYCGWLAAREDCRDCDKLDELCELSKSQGIAEEDSYFCQTYDTENCATCEDLIEECKEGNEESCKKYEEEDCYDCTQMFEACIESGSISSPACKLYKDNRDKLGCPEDCHEWFELCDIGDTESCKKYEDKPCEDASTTECGTEIVGITECCNEGEDALYVDPAFNTEIGMMGSDYDKYYEIHGVKEDKIRFCFVDEVDKNKDPVDDSASKNKYKMMTDSKVASNKYCKVNCREDYAFDFPVAQRVNAGRYFTFRMAITDVHKQCFTNTIDKEQFEKDIKAAQEAIVKATNEYLYWKAAWEHRTDYKYTQGIECPTGCACNQFDNGVYIQVPGVLAWTNPQYKSEYYSFNSQISQPTTQDVYEYEGTIGTHSTGTASCYAGVDAFGVTKYVDKEKTEHNDSPTIPELEQKLTARIDAEWAARVGGVQINAAVAEYARIIAEYNDCSLWKTEIQYDPKVEYDYEETEYSNMASMPREMEKEINIGDVSYEYCLQQGAGKGPKITDNEYKNCTTGFTGSWDYLDDAYTVCRVEGDSAKCYRDDQPRHLVSPVRYMKSNQDAESTHKPSALFYNIYPKGEIQMDNSSGKGVALQRDYSGDTLKLLPVALGTPKGVRRYYINVSNIGEFYNDGDGSLGRFAGSNTSKAVIGENVDYKCAYLINIPEASMKCSTLDTPCDGPECSTECVGPGCEKDFLCEGIDCVTDCVGIGCIYDKHAGTSIYQREVSLTNIFPNGTDAYNWMKNDKGTKTKEEIESAGNSIFDGTPVLSVTITPSVSRSIQNYNDSQNSSGGYSNDTITCQDLGSYEKLACYSSFISDLISGTYGSVNAKVDPNRGSSSYFELWSGTPSEKDMLGPSWK